MNKTKHRTTDLNESLSSREQEEIDLDKLLGLTESEKEMLLTLSRNEDSSFLEDVEDLFEYCDHRFRLGTLLHIIKKYSLNGRDSFILLGNIWPICDSNYVHLKKIRYLLNDFRSDMVHMMTSEEKMELEKLPEEITVYRGCRQTNLNGLSWSLSRDIALRHAVYRGFGKPHLLTGKVKRKDAVLKLEQEELEIFSDSVEIIDYKII
jgi:hypothetical protein